MATTATEWRLPAEYGGHAGSGGAVPWWNTIGILDETPTGTAPNVSYNGPIGSTFNGLTNWLYCQKFGFSVPAGNVVSKVRALFRARTVAGVVTVTRAALRVKRRETPYLSFPVDTELTPNILLTGQWQDFTLEWEGTRVNPTALASIPLLVSLPEFGFAIACSGQNGKAEVDLGKMQLELDDGKEEEEPSEPTLLGRLAEVLDELVEVRELLAKTSPVIEQADTAIGRANALLTDIPPA